MAEQLWQAEVHAEGGVIIRSKKAADRKDLMSSDDFDDILPIEIYQENGSTSILGHRIICVKWTSG